MLNPKPTALMFDFDGTLVDSFGLALELLCELAPHEPLAAKDISRLRGMSSWQLLRVLRVPLWRMPTLTWRARRAAGRHLDRIEAVPGMHDAVRRLSRHYRLFVLSSNSAENVRKVLVHFDMASYFDEIYGSAQPLHKQCGIAKLLRQHALMPQQVWYIGDEVRDIVAAHRAGLKAIAVSWGYNNIAVLEQHRPDALVFSPEELVTHFT